MMQSQRRSERFVIPPCSTKSENQRLHPGAVLPVDTRVLGRGSQRSAYHMQKTGVRAQTASELARPKREQCTSSVAHTLAKVDLHACLQLPLLLLLLDRSSRMRPRLPLDASSYFPTSHNSLLTFKRSPGRSLNPSSDIPKITYSFSLIRIPSKRLSSESDAFWW